MSPEAAIAQDFSLEQWIKTVPASHMVFPKSFGDRLKYIFWRVYTPFHPFVRDSALRLGLRSQSDDYPGGRQPYILGILPPETTVQEFVSYMLSKGFGNHFIAWKDKGQVVSLRYVDSFRYQYHLRVFEDGEVRGHYEFTPECHPVLHMRDANMEPRREEFLRFIGDKIIVAS